jgi:hypothetical protein
MTQGALIGWTVLLGLVALAALVAAYQSRGHRRAIVRSGSNPVRRPGWVYFLSPVDGAEDDPPAPIKVGMTHRDPAVYRLPEIETMSPKPLELIGTVATNTPELLERTIHAELAPFRRHGEWFDRDAVLAWLDDYKENDGRDRRHRPAARHV